MARVPFFFLSFSLVYHHYTCSNNLKIGSLKSDIKITRDDISTETLKIFGSSTALKMNMNWRMGHPQWWFSRLLFFEASDFITPFRLVPLHWSIIPFNDSVLKREKITAKSWWKERLCRKCARDIHSIFGTEKKDLQIFFGFIQRNDIFFYPYGNMVPFPYGKGNVWFVSRRALGSLAINKRVDLSVHERGGSGLS